MCLSKKLLTLSHAWMEGRRNLFRESVYRSFRIVTRQDTEILSFVLVLIKNLPVFSIFDNPEM